VFAFIALFTLMAFEADMAINKYNKNNIQICK